MVDFILSTGEICRVDPADWNRLYSSKWYGKYCRPTIYAARTLCLHVIDEYNKPRVIYRCVYMHRFIMNCPTGYEIDHINGDTLDNRKKNLEIVAPYINQQRSHVHRTPMEKS